MGLGLILATFEKEYMNDEYFIELAIDYLGAAIRDNDRETIIQIGKQIELGEYNE